MPNTHLWTRARLLAAEAVRPAQVTLFTGRHSSEGTVPNCTKVDSTSALTPGQAFSEFPVVFILNGVTFQRLPADPGGHAVYVVVGCYGDPYHSW